MAMGQRQTKQPDLFIPTAALPEAPGHPFYRKLNQLLAQARFDCFVEDLCRRTPNLELYQPAFDPTGNALRRAARAG